MSQDEYTDLIIDIGAYSTVFGRAWGNRPESIERTIVSDSNDPLFRTQFTTSLGEIGITQYFGNVALEYQHVLQMNYFWQHYDVNTMVAFVQYLLKRSNLNPEKCGLIFIVNSFLAEQVKEKLLEQLYNRLKVPRVAFFNQTACIMNALGLSSAVVIDFGFYSTRIEGIFRLFSNITSQIEFPLGGYHITTRFMDLVFSPLQYGVFSPLFELADQFKQTYAKCEVDTQSVIHEILHGSTKYNQELTLPDNRQIVINRELLDCTEVLFSPEQHHIRSDNVIDSITKSIRTWERDQVGELCQNIVLCGMGGQVSGLTQKVDSSLRQQFPESMQIKFLDETAHKILAWEGATILYTKRHGHITEWKYNPKIQQSGGT